MNWHFGEYILDERVGRRRLRDGLFAPSLPYPSGVTGTVPKFEGELVVVRLLSGLA
jgi:hypothetical protein